MSYRCSYRHTEVWNSGRVSQNPKMRKWSVGCKGGFLRQRRPTSWFIYVLDYSNCNKNMDPSPPSSSLDHHEHHPKCYHGDPRQLVTTATTIIAVAMTITINSSSPQSPPASPPPPTPPLTLGLHPPRPPPLPLSSSS